MRKELSKLDWNARELLFEVFPKQFACENYKELLALLTAAKQEMEQHLRSVKEQAIKIVQRVLQLSQEANLLQSLKLWVRQQRATLAHQIYSKHTQRFLHCIEQLETYDEVEIVSELSRQVLDLFIEDWKADGLAQFETSIKEIVEEVQQTKETDEEQNVQKLSFTNSKGVSVEKTLQIEEPDGTSEFLQNEIESALDTYGDYLEPNQKVAVMLRMIEKILEG